MTSSNAINPIMPQGSIARAMHSGQQKTQKQMRSKTSINHNRNTVNPTNHHVHNGGPSGASGISKAIMKNKTHWGVSSAFHEYSSREGAAIGLSNQNRKLL
jgi:hypothetical protein